MYRVVPSRSKTRDATAFGSALETGALLVELLAHRTGWENLRFWARNFAQGRCDEGFGHSGCEAKVAESGDPARFRQIWPGFVMIGGLNGSNQHRAMCVELGTRKCSRLTERENLWTLAHQSVLRTAGSRYSITPRWRRRG